MQAHEYILLTASWCHVCPSAKAAVEASGLPCRIIDVDSVDEDDRALIQQIGARSMPVLTDMRDGVPYQQWTGSQIDRALCTELLGRFDGLAR